MTLLHGEVYYVMHMCTLKVSCKGVLLSKSERERVEVHVHVC